MANDNLDRIKSSFDSFLATAENAEIEALLDGCGEYEGFQTEEFAAIDYVSAPAFWMELDDALAAKGWNTMLLHSQNDSKFEYTVVAPNRDLDGKKEAQGASRLAAVRSVYERVMQGEKR